ncbi:MAG TPA: urease accessory protein UreE [Desulfocapsa sulfexigens]|nr:urease accessory protein UreE [Desulfocapsa sulfexigens]
MLRFTKKSTGDAQEPLTTLTLPWESRTKSRLRVRLDNGNEAGLFLERGIILRDGDYLQTDDGITLEIKAAPETVSTVRCSDPLQMARICYHLGNRHVELEITEGRIRYPHDHVLDKMLISMGHEVKVEQAPLEPEAGAYDSSHGHHHHD